MSHSGGLVGGVISILLNAGDGTLTTGELMPFYVGSAPLKVLDVDEDGHLDLLTTEPNANQVVVVFGDGSGNLVRESRYRAGISPRDVVACDVIGDARLDLITADSGGHAVSVLRGVEDPLFDAPILFPAGGNPLSVVCVDLNEDGWPDLATANEDDDTNGRLSSLEHQHGGRLEIEYNGAGRIERVRDDDGRTTQYRYDAANEHLIEVEYFDGRTVAYAYQSGVSPASEHALTEIVYPDGSHQNFIYKTDGTIAVMHRDGDAEHASFFYDRGTVTALTNDGETEHFRFDQHGVMVQYENGLGHQWTRTFDERHNLATTTDPAGNTYGFWFGAGRRGHDHPRSTRAIYEGHTHAWRWRRPAVPA